MLSFVSSFAEFFREYLNHPSELFLREVQPVIKAATDSRKPERDFECSARLYTQDNVGVFVTGPEEYEREPGKFYLDASIRIRVYRAPVVRARFDCERNIPVVFKQGCRTVSEVLPDEQECPFQLPAVLRGEAFPWRTIMQFDVLRNVLSVFHLSNSSMNTSSALPYMSS